MYSSPPEHYSCHCISEETLNQHHLVQLVHHMYKPFQQLVHDPTTYNIHVMSNKQVA